MTEFKFTNNEIINDGEIANARLRADQIDSKDGFIITKSLVGTTATTAANYGVIFIAPIPCELISVREIHETASTSGTLDIERLQGTEALDAGDSLIVTPISLSGTANTVSTKTGSGLTATKANRILKIGDRLALKDAGTLTNQVGVTVTMYMRPIGRGGYI